VKIEGKGLGWKRKKWERRWDEVMIWREVVDDD